MSYVRSECGALAGFGSTFGLGSAVPARCLGCSADARVLPVQVASRPQDGTQGVWFDWYQDFYWSTFQARAFYQNALARTRNGHLSPASAKQQAQVDPFNPARRAPAVWGWDTALKEAWDRASVAVAGWNDAMGRIGSRNRIALSEQQPVNSYQALLNPDRFVAWQLERVNALFIVPSQRIIEGAARSGRSGAALVGEPCAVLSSVQRAVDVEYRRARNARERFLSDHLGRGVVQAHDFRGEAGDFDRYYLHPDGRVPDALRTAGRVRWWEPYFPLRTFAQLWARERFAKSVRDRVTGALAPVLAPCTAILEAAQKAFEEAPPLRVPADGGPERRKDEGGGLPWGWIAGIGLAGATAFVLLRGKKRD